MRRLLLHLSTALVAFVVGVTTAMIFGLVPGPSARQSFAPVVYEVPPPPPRVRSCPNTPKFLHELPEPPRPPAPPLAPEPLKKRTRVVTRRADGTVRVVETQTREARRAEF